MNNPLRQLLEDIKAKKKVQEKIIDEFMFASSISSAKLLRCATRHWSDREEVWEHLYKDVTEKHVREAFDIWYDCHVEYEYMITQDPEIYEEVRLDRFNRALKDSQHWI